MMRTGKHPAHATTRRNMMPVDVDVLIHEHKQAVHTVDGIEIHSVPSLIWALT